MRETEEWWREWSSRCTYQGEWREAVVRSLITLKALTYAPTGGIVAAATTSLPEKIGGVRNWDYRFCWLRDATFTLYAFLMSGYHDEARAWREWLLRAVAGKASQLNIIYGVAGERRLTEFDAGLAARLRELRAGADRQCRLQAVSARRVRRGHGRSAPGPPRRFAGDRRRLASGARAAGLSGIPLGPAGRRHLGGPRPAAAFHALQGDGLGGVRPGGQGRRAASAWKAPSSAGANCAIRSTRRSASRDSTQRSAAFVQSYGSKEFDASLLMMAEVGFLPANDPRIRGTVAAIERHLMTDGFVARYAPASGIDGTAARRRSVPALHVLARRQLRPSGPARPMPAGCSSGCSQIRNDVGLLSEEYDPVAQRLLGNFPQAFSHVGLVNTAHNLVQPGGPAKHRRQG